MARKSLPDLFAEGLPEGLVYRENVLAVPRAQALVGLLGELPFKPFEFHGYLGHRRVVSYGWRYDYGGRALLASSPIPDFLMELRAIAGEFAATSPEQFAQALVTEYAPGAGIGWHRDKAEFGIVAAFSFVSACRLRFRRRNGSGWDRRGLSVEPRSAYLLQGPSRTVWEHSIPPVEGLRYSVTLRTLAAPTDME
jgi:alkylated DNA repair dioxygenase AlkB